MVVEEACIAEISSIGEYLDFIKEYRRKRDPDEELWYRGHRTNMWNLKPNLYRDAKLDIGELADGEIAMLRYAFADFKKGLDNLDVEISSEIRTASEGINSFHKMFISQHYGWLTPVLDWTADPLVALYFALDKYDEKKEDEFPVIYIFKPGLCNAHSFFRYDDDTDITTPLCIDDIENIDSIFDDWTKDLNTNPAGHIPVAIFSKLEYSIRISRQSGKFTFHSAVGPRNYAWNDIDIKGEKLADPIRIKPGAVNDIKEYLWALNINEQSIYGNRVTALDKRCIQLQKEASEELKNSGP